MSVFYSNVIIKLVPEGMINGVYRPDEGEQFTKVCEIVGVGPGFYNEESNKWVPLPFGVGDKVVVCHRNWIPIDCESSDEKEWCITPDLIIKKALVS